MTSLAATVYGPPVRDGWRQLSPGIYDDGQSSVQIDAAELCAHHGAPLTDRNITVILEAVDEVLGELFGPAGPPITLRYYHGAGQ